MPTILIGSRSFGQFVSIGRDLLLHAGFHLRWVRPEERPLDVNKLKALVREEAPVAIITGTEPLTREVLAVARGLRLVVKHGVGIDNIDLEAATSLGILVANAPNTNTEAVAELTIGMMLSLLRGLCRSANSARAGGWEPIVGHELGRMIVGVVGTGRIGSQVIRYLHSFGSTIIAYDVVKNEELVSRYGVRYVSLEELLASADIVTLHVPLTEKTRRMIGARELALMKKTAFLINTARGELVDEEALYNYLSEGRIAGAGLDVFSTEPPKGNPLLKLPNVLATTHIGGYTYEAMERMDRTVAETIIAVLLVGQQPANILNPAAFDVQR
uniref:Hydroxyacid dehydrogenase n=1 Tax=Candidatus Methanosuratincola petrocarbonis (ex Vanwonterghem et al. 2016) TaxID=1867261 RepID=A0A7J3UZC2_9CREN